MKKAIVIVLSIFSILSCKLDNEGINKEEMKKDRKFERSFDVIL